VRTLFGFLLLFDVLDAFLQFLLKDILDELLSFGAEKVIEVVNGTTEWGGVHDEIAFVEQGIEFFA